MDRRGNCKETRKHLEINENENNIKELRNPVKAC